MISVSGRRWEQKKIDKNSLEKLKQDYDFSEIVSKIILSRKFDETEITSINHRLKLNNVFFKCFLILVLSSIFRSFFSGESKFLKIFDFIIADPKFPFPPINKIFLVLVN